MTKPPLRLLDDPAVAGSLRANLQRVQAADNAYDAQRGLQRLQSSLQPTAAVKQAASAPSRTLPVTSGKVLWLTTLGVTVALGASLRLLPDLRQPHDDKPQRSQARPATEPPTPAAEPSTFGPAARPSEDTGIRREIEQLMQIRALLPQQPAAAYELAQRSAREFPDGALREEREALSALALARIGKRVEAREAARAFLRRYPQSPLKAAIDPLTSERR